MTDRTRFIDYLDKFLPRKLSTNDVIEITDKAVEIFQGETYCTKCNGIGMVYTSPPEICERCGGMGAQP